MQPCSGGNEATDEESDVGFPTEHRALYPSWVAVKDLSSSCYIGETILINYYRYLIIMVPEIRLIDSNPAKHQTRGIKVEVDFYGIFNKKGYPERSLKDIRISG